MRPTVIPAFCACALVVVSATAMGPVPTLFATADACIACHNNMVGPKGEDISIGADWRSSMMANSSRDPYWQASVRRETIVHATADAQIQHECAACHMPMSRFTAKADGRLGEVFAHLPIVTAHESPSLLAADGVSCAMCHQIRDDRLGEKASFTGGFAVDTTTPLGDRAAFGPYDVDAGRTRLMRSASRFVPERSVHIQRSEVCATCHTLYTHALDEDGNVVGELPEQVPYLEWLHSDYADDGGRSCQSCHMPVVEDPVPITGVMGTPRDDVSRHVFRGGNFLMPRVLNLHRDELGVTAQPQELETTSRRTVEHLETAAAKLSVGDVRTEDGTLQAEVRVENLAGHKLPTAYPSRRAWLHVAVVDAGGQLVFESGRVRPDGSIVGNDNDAAADRYEPHYSVIRHPDQVQIYEGILADSRDRVTTVLLSAVRYIKDNRLPPKGFDVKSADDDIAVNGEAAGDRSFTGGSDTVTYEVELPDGATGPFAVHAELWYQPIAHRWAHNLSEPRTEEGRRFVGYYEHLASSSGVVLARAAGSTP